MSSPSELSEKAQTCFRLIFKSCKNRHHAIESTLGLICDSIAKRKGLTKFANGGVQTEISIAENTLTECLKLFSGMDFDIARNPFCLGDIYQILLETPEDSASKSEVRTLRSRRLNRGVFYTPGRVVKEMLDNIGSGGFPDAFFCDPGMGAGNFIIGRVLQFSESLQKQRRVADRCYGLDLDSLAIKLAKTIIWLLLSIPGDEYAPRSANLLCEDALLPQNGDHPFPEIVRRGGFDLIAGNPPYEVLTNFSKRPEAKEYAGRLRKSGLYPLSGKGQINLYRNFIERSLNLLRPGGKLSLIVPAGIMKDHVAAPLRKSLLNNHRADLFELHSESKNTFAGVCQSVAIFRAEKDAGKAEYIDLIRNANTQTVDADQLRMLSGELVIPDASDEDWKLLEWLWNNATSRFETIADGMVGEVDQTIYGCHMKSSDTGNRLLRGTHLSAFLADLNPQDHTNAFLDKAGFLEQKKTSADLCMQRVSRPRIVQLGIRNMESRPRLIAARIAPGIFTGNSLNVWLPREGFSSGLIAGLLNSSLYDWRFRISSGNNNINVCEINPLPLPEKLDKENVAKIESAYEKCEQAAAKKARTLPKLRTELNNAVIDLFGIPDRMRTIASQ